MFPPETGQLVNRARDALPGGWLGDLILPEAMTLVAARGKGSRLFDVDGRSFLDLTCGGGSLILGHTHPAVTEAVRKQLELGSTFYTLNSRSIELAEALIDAIPCAEQVRFASAGAEATFYMLRLARAFTGKKKIMKFEGSYVGHHDYGMISVSPPESNTPLSPHMDSAGIPDELKDLVVIAPFNDTETTCALIEKHAHELAAVLVEPVQRSIPPARGFLEAIREATKRNNMLLVFDEVVTGFRLAYGGAQERFGVVPDLAAYGKAVACGYPLSAVAGRQDVMALADPSLKGKPNYVYFSGTLSGNPLCCSASLATLEELRKPGTFEKLNATGDRFREGLAEVFKRHGITAQVIGIGSFFQIFFTPDPVKDYRGQTRANRALFEVFARNMFAKGIFLSRRAKNYISTAHSDSDLDEFLTAADAVCAAGLRAA
jgi:glutamate-1-semialdehyde 2,1-aminomutase